MRAREAQRRRRQDLGWYVLGFAAVQLGLALGLECAWPALRDPDFDYLVRVALALTDKPDLALASLADLPGARVFQMPPLAGSWSRCLDGLEHPYTRRIRPITFDHDAPLSALRRITQCGVPLPSIASPATKMLPL